MKADLPSWGTSHILKCTATQNLNILKQLSFKPLFIYSLKDKHFSLMNLPDPQKVGWKIMMQKREKRNIWRGGDHVLLSIILPHKSRQYGCNLSRELCHLKSLFFFLFKKMYYF